MIAAKFLKASITTADFNDRVSFWLEKGLTTFSADSGNFYKANIKGSKIQHEQNKLNKILDTSKNTTLSEFSFVKENPNSIVSAYILSVYCASWNKDTVAKLYKAFSKEVRSTAYANKVAAFISLNRNIQIGDRFVDFSQKDSSDRLIKLSDIIGKVILLEFWGSWCGPCREKNPTLRVTYKEFKGKGFEIVGVAVETDKKQWIKAIKTDGLTWTNVTDLKGSSNKAAMIYGVSGYPTNFLIDRNGIVVAKDVYEDDLQNLLLKIL